MASPTAFWNSRVFQARVGDEKISVKVEPPARGSSRSMSFDARPDSAVSMNPPLSSLPPCPAMKPDATSMPIETMSTIHRKR